VIGFSHSASSLSVGFQSIASGDQDPFFLLRAGEGVGETEPFRIVKADRKSVCGEYTVLAPVVGGTNFLSGRRGVVGLPCMDW